MLPVPITPPVISPGPAPNPNPNPQLPAPQPTPTEKPKINLDTGTAIAFCQDGYPDIAFLESRVAGKQMVMRQTARDEFSAALAYAGPLEQAKATVFLTRVQLIFDLPSARAMQLVEVGRVTHNDKIIFGTGDTLNITTMTGDGAFVRAASEPQFQPNPVSFNAIIHIPARFTGR